MKMKRKEIVLWTLVALALAANIWLPRQMRYRYSWDIFVIGGYFLWPYSLQRDPKYLFSDSTDTRLAKRGTKYRCNSVR